MAAPTDIELDDNARKIMRLFEARHVDASVASCTVAPQVTRYGLAVHMGTKVSDVLALSKDVAFLLGFDNIAVKMPTNGEARLTVDVPRIDRAYISRDDVPVPADASALTYTLGRTIAGSMLTANLADDVHLLVAGITGSGKSVFLTNLLLDLITRNAPEQLRLVLIDPKVTAFTPFARAPHLVSPIITESVDAVDALQAAKTVMADHTKLFAAHGVDDIAEYNALGLGSLPYTVIVVDELADLLASHKKEISPLLIKLATKGRAAGIILILATQKPTADLIPTALKSSLPSSVAFRVRSQSDSRVALDQGGAEHLLGMGDGLYLANGTATAVRFQAPYVSKAGARELLSVHRAVPTAIAKNPEGDPPAPESRPASVDALAEAIRRAGTGLAADAPVVPAGSAAQAVSIRPVQDEPAWPTQTDQGVRSHVSVFSHITYTVAGEGDAETIRYRDRGVDEQVHNVPLPWTKTVRLTDPEDYGLTATGQRIKVYVQRDGQLIARK